MCGIVGVFGVDEAQVPLFRMMSVLQYRGEQSCGYSAVGTSGVIYYKKELGHIRNLLENNPDLNKNFYAGIGHLRYGTAGMRKSIENAQPFFFIMEGDEVHLAHNGDTPFFNEMRESLLQRGAILRTNSDTELLLNFIGMHRNGGGLVLAVRDGLAQYKGTYSVVILIRESGKTFLVGARDHSGNRPLLLGRLGKGFLLASEDHAFEAVKGDTIREISPGEMVVISDEGVSEHAITNQYGVNAQQCAFELNYFGLPSSKFFGVSVHKAREDMGVHLARIHAHKIQPDDIITYVPDSSTFFGLGFCKLMQMPLEIVFLRRHHGAVEPIRSFTEATEQTREDAVRNKFSVIRDKVVGKRVILLDDSIVRGTVSKKLIALLLEAGAKEVIMIVSFPPVIGPCYKGMDFSANLLAARHIKDGVLDREELQKEIGASFIGYPELEDWYEVLRKLGANPKNFCFGCAQNKDPIWGAW